MMTQRIFRLMGALCVSPTLLFSAEDVVDFEKEILPIFTDNCFDCHGPDKQKGELRLDSRVSLLKGGDTGFPAIVPGDASKSQMTHLDDSRLLGRPPLEVGESAQETHEGKAHKYVNDALQMGFAPVNHDLRNDAVVRVGPQ